MRLINASNWPKTEDAQTGLVYYQPKAFSIKAGWLAALDSKTWAATDGAFACLIFDPISQEIILSRDHFGLEPFYYYLDHDKCIFGSCLPDVIKHLKQPRPNMEQLFSLFTYTQTYSDETFYQHIHRVEPGHILHIKNNKIVKKYLFWDLKQYRPMQQQPLTDEEYLSQFSALLKKAVGHHISQKTDLAGELSDGLDTAAILLAATLQNVQYPLYMLTHSTDEPLESNEQQVVHSLLKRLHHNQIKFITLDNFDPLTTFQRYAELFAGGAPNLSGILNQSFHQTIAQHGHKILLSGLGGNQCVSNPAMTHQGLASHIQQHGYWHAWQELIKEYHFLNHAKPSILYRAEQLFKYANPAGYRFFSQFTEISDAFKRFFNREVSPLNSHPFYHSIQEYEWDMLQGPNSHKIRMQIEYNAVLAKALGFEYRYPLLDPQLIEFCIQLPLTLKRREGVGRYLLRQYLSQHTPLSLYSKSQKNRKMTHTALEKCTDYLNKGYFEDHFVELPYLNFAVQNPQHLELFSKINAYMFKWAHKKFL